MLLVAESPLMQDLLRVLRQAASFRVPILLYGEAGTGKRRLAEWAASQQPLPVSFIDCSAGFSAASPFPSSGEVVLDNVDDLDAEGQLGLLAALRAATEVTAVSTSEHVLESLPGFRRDLLYRLAGMTATVPPLRDRKEDILPLAELFLLKWQEKLEGRGGWSLSEDDASTLERYRWPGNVRELENTVLRSCALQKLQLPPASTQRVSEWRLALRAFKREYLLKALDETGWNQTKAAKALHIQRSYLAKMVADLGLRAQRQ